MSICVENKNDNALIKSKSIRQRYFNKIDFRVHIKYSTASEKIISTVSPPPTANRDTTYFSLSKMAAINSFITDFQNLTQSNFIGQRFCD